MGFFHFKSSYLLIAASIFAFSFTSVAMEKKVQAAQKKADQKKVEALIGLCQSYKTTLEGMLKTTTETQAVKDKIVKQVECDNARCKCQTDAMMSALAGGRPIDMAAVDAAKAQCEATYQACMAAIH